MRFLSRKRGAVVALGAAVLIVLQSLLGAVATAEASAARDLFGNVLCLTDPDTSAPVPLHDGHAKMPPDCCMAGCSLLSAVLAAPEGQHLAWLQWPVSGKTLPRREDAGALPARLHEPGKPRAPPLTV